MGLSEDFYKLLDNAENDPQAQKRAARLVFEAEEGPESSGLLALMYHDGIGVDQDMEKAFKYAEEAAEENEGLALYLLGHMCEHGETPDQEFGGDRQKYDHYDAEDFMERCTKTDSSWAESAHLWLGNFFMDMARGGDPEIALEHYEAIGENNAEAAGKLCDYYWERWEYETEVEGGNPNNELAEKVFYWTHQAVRLDPCEFSFRMGCCYADGIACDPEKGFRLARKYWEDAYDFGNWWAAEAIAALYQDRLDNLPEDAPESERQNCHKQIESWLKLAAREKARQDAIEPDPSQEED